MSFVTRLHPTPAAAVAGARRATATVATAALPGDVRLLDVTAKAILALAAAVALALALTWAARWPGFALRDVRVEGDLQRVDGAVLRATVAPRVDGNFFSADLGAARAAFESVPWVRRAVVRRVWPDRLLVRVEEQRPAALWQTDDRPEAGDDRLVNAQGEVFAANVGDVEDESLPLFSGPEGSAAVVLAMYRRLLPLLEPLDAAIDELQMSGRGSWRVSLDSGAVLELGRGGEDEVAARVQRFVRTVPAVTQRFRAPLEYADLRHADGYALRLRGVTTTAAPAASAGSAGSNGTSP
jgi:cell division protein FtsQ